MGSNVLISPGCRASPPIFSFHVAPTTKGKKRRGQCCGPGTPPSRMETDMNLDDGLDKKITKRNQTGKAKDKSLDNGSDLVECEICHRKFKRRGIKIHLSKSRCGQILEDSRRKICKSEENQSQEEHHSAEVIHRRRLPFIVSQTYHSRNQQTNRQEEEISWNDFLIEQENEEEQQEGKIIEEKRMSSQFIRKTITQRPITDFMNPSQRQPNKESEFEKKFDIKTPEGNRRSEKKGDARAQERETARNQKLTHYFGIKVKGESGLGEWLNEMEKIKLEEPDVVPEKVHPKEDSDRSWMIIDNWEEDTNETLEFTDKELNELKRVVERGEEKEVIALHHLQVTRKDLKSLCFPNYVNDTIIDEYLLMIKARNPESFAVLNSYFFQRLDTLGLEEGMRQTETWIKEDLRYKENILIPICKNDHWRLIHVDNKKKVVYYLDSLIGSRKISSAPRIIKDFMEKYHSKRGNACQYKTKVRWDIPCQHNGVDCGVFLCAYAERISRNVGFNFKQSDMALFRWKIVWEICNGSLKEWVRMKRERPTTVDQPIKKKKPNGKKKEVKEPVQNSSEGRKNKIKWPAGNSKEWEKLDIDLSMILRKVGSTPEEKAELHPQLIYSFCLERFGEEEPRKKKSGKMSRRQTKCQKLRQQIKQQKEKWKHASNEERVEIEQNQEESIRNLRLLKRAESIRKRRKKYKQNSDSFYNQPYNFARKVLDPQVNGELQSSQTEVEDFLRKNHGDALREEELGDIEGLIQFTEPEFDYQSLPPSRGEFQAVLKKARTKSAPGPNGVPYRFYKKCPEVARLLFNYIRCLWRKNKIPECWRRAEGVLIPKEDKATKIDRYRTISLLNTEGKIFWKLKANRMTDYIMKNKFIDSSIQKGGIPGVSGCLEHTAILTQLISEAKKNKTNLVSVWLDIANAYGSIAHKLLQLALERTHIPEPVRELVRSYYDKVEIRFTTNKFTTNWIRVERGIITGCTLSVILFAQTMTMLLASTKKETKGPRTSSGQLQENSRLYMDDVNITTNTITQAHHLLREVSRFFKWGRLIVKPSKCRALVLEKGVPKKNPVYWEDREITSVLKEEIRYLGKEYNHLLTDNQQINETMKKLKTGLKKIDRTVIAQKCKCWILQNMMIPRLIWPLTIYAFPQSKVEQMEKDITRHLKKWLGIPKSMSTDLLYARSSVLQLPFSSIVEEGKVAKARTKVMLEASEDDCISKANINLDAGRKWKVGEAVEDARSRLRMQDIAGIANLGKEGLGMNLRKYYKGSSEKEKKQLIVKKIREAEEESRLVRVAALAKQSQTLDWGVQQKMVKRDSILGMPEAQLQFTIKAVYDLLPTPANKNLWFRTDQYACHLCGGTGSLSHILSGCKIALAQGRYKWRHDRVLRELCFWLEEKRKSINNTQWKRKPIKFVKAGERSKEGKSHQTPIESVLKNARDWKMKVDLPESPLVIPAHIAVTSQRPDVIITSEAIKQMYIIELTVPMEGRCEISTELKRTKYELNLAEAAKMKGWRTTIYTVEIGCRGFASSSIINLLKDMGFSGAQRRSIVKKLCNEAEESSMHIWKCSHFKNWGRE